MAVVVGVMSVEGYSNLQSQWNIQGEYQNVPTEQLIDWINEHTSHSEFVSSLAITHAPTYLLIYLLTQLLTLGFHVPRHFTTSAQ